MHQFIYMLTTLAFWLTLVVFINVGTAMYFGLPKAYARWLRYQSNRRIATLRLSPTVLKNKLKDRDRLIAHLEGELLEAGEMIAQLEDEVKEQRKEIKRLSGRNDFMAREIICDEGSDTQVFRGKWSARF